jgi:predicted RNA binding protein YcfA (HicA-like mRNA interferase family)
MLLDDGWSEIGVTGPHHHFRHPNKPGKITLPHPRADLPATTVRAILKPAGLLE